MAADSEGNALPPELSGAFDFFDFGCSTGANILHTQSVLPGLRGLGIDIDKAKIAQATEKGHEAIVFDILRLPDDKLVAFVTMAHFLEHLPGIIEARKMIAKAISVSRDSVLIRQPWFDADGELFSLGCKFYWSHWNGHRNKMTTLDFHSILTRELESGRVNRFILFGRNPVAQTNHPSILPLSAAVDQHAYDKSAHGPKPIAPLRNNAYKEIVACIQIGSAETSTRLLRTLSPLTVLYDSLYSGVEPL